MKKIFLSQALIALLVLAAHAQSDKKVLTVADYDQATKTWEITYTLPFDTPGDVRKARWLRFALSAN